MWRLAPRLNKHNTTDGDDSMRLLHGTTVLVCALTVVLAETSSAGPWRGVVEPGPPGIVNRLATLRRAPGAGLRDRAHADRLGESGRVDRADHGRPCEGGETRAAQGRAHGQSRRARGFRG